MAPIGRLPGGRFGQPDAASRVEGIMKRIRGSGPLRTVLCLLAALPVMLAGCGAPPEPAPGERPAPTSAEQTLTDLFNLTALYQRMGRLTGGNPLPFVGSLAYFAGRGDSTIVMMALSLDNRALSFQRSGR